MFPTTFIDKVECLESLVGIRTGCTVTKQYPFWIEDIEGIDVPKLATMAKKTNPSGKDFAKQLINNASRQMIGNIEMLLNNGFKMKNIVGDMCSTCTLLPTYVANSGIIVKSVVATRFQVLRITKLTILANVSGVKELTIDDGVSPQVFDVTLSAGLLVPVVIDYVTTEKSVKIFFTDITVPLGLISCPTSSSCGCGGSVSSNNPINIKGLLGGVEVSAQYGFLPCAAVDCSYESLVCHLIKQTPNIFGLALLYKVGELYYDNKNVSDRNTESVAFNDDEEKEQKKNYARLYWATIKGSSGVIGINRVINDYLKTYRADKCITCEANISTAYVTG